ncbi:MAG: hypothetical protein JWR33_393 [Naasia sp.]|nr:hypothetical protein [Naasia sp.]
MPDATGHPDRVDSIPPYARRDLVVPRDLKLLGEADRELRRAQEAGDLVRIRRGAYVSAASWRSLDDRGRHIARARAVREAATTEPVFSHLTAAAVHGVPLPHPFPGVVDITVDRESGAKSKGDIRRHAIGIDPPSIERVQGLLVTDLPRTVADVAMTTGLQSALPAVDWALAKGVVRATLFAAVEGTGVRAGAARAEAAIGLGEGASGSVGESLSRAGMHVLGFPRPELQLPVHDRHGLVGLADFAWPQRRLLGEFDGRGKYLREEFTRGREAGEIVLAEKRREDRMRAQGWLMVRWGWEDARDLARLDRVLRDAGLTPRA